MDTKASGSGFVFIVHLENDASLLLSVSSHLFLQFVTLHVCLLVYNAQISNFVKGRYIYFLSDSFQESIQLGIRSEE